MCQQYVKKCWVKIFCHIHNKQRKRLYPLIKDVIFSPLRDKGSQAREKLGYVSRGVFKNTLFTNVVAADTVLLRFCSVGLRVEHCTKESKKERQKMVGYE